MIELRNLRTTYGKKVAVDGIDLDVADGEIIGFLGPNGAGKTTTVECIAGLRRPDAGHVRVMEHNPFTDRDAITGLMGVQLQQAGLQAKLTVREALDLYASFYDAPRDAIDMAHRLSLGDSLDVRYGKLSGGQQQRVAIALALIGRPRIALLDELTTGLDPRSRHDVWQLITQIRESGTTIILVTHLMEEAQRLCDRLAIIDGGRVTALDTPAGLVASSHTPTIMTFTPSSTCDLDSLRALTGVIDVRDQGERIELIGNDESVTAALHWLSSNDITPGRLRVSESTLDDAYLDLTKPQLSTQRASPQEN